MLESIELRYSIRSLTNLPHGRVWISGLRPRWLVGVEHVPGANNLRSKQANSVENLWNAVQSEDLSDRFVFMNDDFFVLRSRPVISPWHRGVVHPHIRDHLPPPNKIVRQHGYRNSMGQTCHILRDWGVTEPLSYELHVPMIVDRREMLQLLRKARQFPFTEFNPRTLYGNTVGDRGTEMLVDQKVSSLHEVADDDWDFVSTNDHTFRHGDVGRQLRALFPEPSEHEDLSLPSDHETLSG